MNRLCARRAFLIDQGLGMASRAGVPQSRLQHPQSGIRRRDAGQVRAAGGAAAGSGCRCSETEGRAQSTKKASPETEDEAHRGKKAYHEIEDKAHRAQKGIASETPLDHDSRAHSSGAVFSDDWLSRRCIAPGPALCERRHRSFARRLTGSMSGLPHFADSSRTSREVREVPGPDSCSAANDSRRPRRICRSAAHSTVARRK
jgi:hypothetical protein